MISNFKLFKVYTCKPIALLFSNLCTQKEIWDEYFPIEQFENLEVFSSVFELTINKHILRLLPNLKKLLVNQRKLRYFYNCYEEIQAMMEHLAEQKRALNRDLQIYFLGELLEDARTFADYRFQEKYSHLFESA